MREVNNPYVLMKELERRSRIIRSSRIEASKRYKSDDNFYRFVTIFYSILVTVITIRFAFGLDILGDSDNKNLSIILLVMSVFVTLFTMYVSIKNAGEKVGRFQSNYMELTRLLADIQLANVYYKMDFNHEELLRVHEDYKKFSNRYAASLLTQIDNHDDIDYWKAVKREEEENEVKVLLADKKIQNYTFWKYCKRVLALLSVPLLLIILLIIENLLPKVL